MEIGNRKERVQLGCVLLQPPVANLAEAPLVLDHAKDMFDSGLVRLLLLLKDWSAQLSLRFRVALRNTRQVTPHGA